MPADPPINFEPLAASAGGEPFTGYPHRLKASDMMKNWVFATLDIDADLVEEQAGLNGHPQRKLKIQPGTAPGQLAVWNGSRWVPTPTPTSANTMLLWTGTAWTSTPAPPETGTHVLGAVGGVISWIATEEC